MRKQRVHILKNKINQKLAGINVEKLRSLRGILRRVSIASSLVLLILILKKANLKPTNHLLDFIGRQVRMEINLIEEAKNIYGQAEKLITANNKILHVFKPEKEEKLPSPISGTLHRGYEKGKNEGLDIRSDSGDDPLAITEGRVSNLEIIDKKGYFLTVEKENLEITYGYLSKSYLEIGDKVEKGKPLGSLGMNKDQAKYLRLEMKLDGKTVDPSEYINIK